MRSRKPYLLRAIHEWICDSGMTPHALIDCNQSGVQVPSEVIKEGRVVLNLSPMAVHDLSLSNDWVTFSARFGGQVRQVSFPPAAVLAIYAKENGQGLMFGAEEDGDEPSPPPPTDGSKGTRPRLSVVK